MTKEILIKSAIKLLVNEQVKQGSWGYGYALEEDGDYEVSWKDVLKWLEQQPKTGHWICHREHCENLGVIPSGLGAYEWCSNCDCGIDVTEFHMNHYNFCPNCGAKMENEDEK